jgi:arylsulfatase A-like enzyme
MAWKRMLTLRTLPVPELLQQAAYRTLTAGKWRLGLEGQSRAVRGFNRSEKRRLRERRREPRCLEAARYRRPQAAIGV